MENEKALLQQEKLFADVMLTGCRIQMFTEEQLSTFVPVYNDQAAGEGSLSDPNLGIIGPGLCPRCFRDDIGCQGHMGRIQLADMVYNPYMIQGVVRVLNSVCWDCGRLKLSEVQLKSHGIFKYKGFARLNAIAELSLSCSLASCSYRPLQDDIPCVGCGPFQNKPGELIIYRKPLPSSPASASSSSSAGGVGLSESLSSSNSSSSAMVMVPSSSAATSSSLLSSSSSSSKKDWDPVNIRDIFHVLDAITERDAHLLGFDNKTHPRNMIMKSFPSFLRGIVRRRYATETFSRIRSHSSTVPYCRRT